ncbi:hypothetical protein ACXZ1K_15815 [Pedobacter sp. PWIIR3]
MNTNNKKENLQGYYDFMNEINNTFPNRNNVTVFWGDDVSLHGYLTDIEESSTQIVMYLKREELLKTFTLKTVKDLDQITIDYLWQNYRNGKAYLSFDLDFLVNGTMLEFMVVNGITKVNGAFITHSNEVPEVFDHLDGFMNYVNQHAEELLAAADGDDRQRSW